MLQCLASAHRSPHGCLKHYLQVSKQPDESQLTLLISNRAEGISSLFILPRDWSMPSGSGYHCLECGEEETDDKKLLKCAKCKTARYCSKECQVRDPEQASSDRSMHVQKE